ncbi:MAG: hypothetical protein NC116_12245 [Clostridium sp.]|nr:hypothetical protein [Clostridium sp.]
MVPKVMKQTDLPQVGEILQGYPAMANIFLNALINRIALVRIKSATFNNRFAFLKKGYLEYGETIEDIFVDIAKVRAFDPEKAPAREFARTLPNVRSQFHVINWRVQYPITVEPDDLKTAFTNAEGVTGLIEMIVEQVYQGEEYDEYLLFKYLLIKQIANGNLSKEYIPAGDMKEAAVAYRATAELMTFRKNIYNTAGVTTATPRERQVIFMDARYNARFDVEVLASAFNMDKTTFLNQLVLVDDWNTFDNERFEQVRKESDYIEEVTAEELEKMNGVKAVILDSDWFQVYDNLINFGETKVSSGNYWNYFLNVYKTIDFSIFANARAFVDTDEVPLISFTAKVTQVGDYGSVKLINLGDVTGVGSGRATQTISTGMISYQQGAELTKDGVGVQPYGTYMVPMAAYGKSYAMSAKVRGQMYVTSPVILSQLNPGDTINFVAGVEPATVCYPSDEVVKASKSSK